MKATQKKVIYMTKGDLEKLATLEIPKESGHLECVRDVFLLCCFTGLRHSDYNSMKPYIDIVDSIKAQEMMKLDTLL